ncbi:MAG: hypothetical protein LBS83_02105 [Holosporales bacterium]|jgi:cell division transport system permease protein|nr:hypothetical protein [Holosporales bacterium]
MKNFSFYQGASSLTPAKNKSGLSLIFVFMVFLLSFIICCTFLFANGFHGWKNGREYKITVEIPFGSHSVGESFEHFAKRHLEKVSIATWKIKQMPKVINVEKIAPEKIRNMLAIWTGEKKLNTEFQLPTLLDVSFEHLKDVEIENIKQELRTISSDITIESHGIWSQKLSILGQNLEIISLIVSIFILICTSIIVSLITKSSLQTYYSTLDILRLMGAKDSYIANIFQSHIMKASVKGGIIGFFLSLPAVYALMMALQYLGLNGVMWAPIFGQILLILVIIPIILLILNIIISRITILSHLRHLDACL